LITLASPPSPVYWQTVSAGSVYLIFFIGSRILNDMYVRWKKNIRKREKNSIDNKVTLCAVIVECYRENGKPKQRFRKYLASIREVDLNDSYSRKLFWRKVNKKLNTLENIKDLKAITSKLQAVVADNTNSVSSSQSYKKREDKKINRQIRL